MSGHSKLGRHLRKLLAGTVICVAPRSWWKISRCQHFGPRILIDGSNWPLGNFVMQRGPLTGLTVQGWLHAGDGFLAENRSSVAK